MRTAVAATGFTLFWAAVCNFALEYVDLNGNLWDFVHYTLQRDWRVFLVGTAVLWIMLLFLVFVIGRLWLSTAVFTVLMLVMGFTNHEKLVIRREPLYPSDAHFTGDVGFMAGMISTTAVVGIGLASGLIILILVLTGRLTKDHFPRVGSQVESRRLRGAILAGRCIMVLSLASGLWYIDHFNAPGNLVRIVYERAGAHWAFWDQALNYQRNGFIGGLLYNLDVPAMARPPDYNRATMQSIAAKYTKLAAKINRSRDSNALNGVNVVAVLSEAFSDPTRLRGVRLAQDPIPFTRQLLAHTISGNALVPQYGGGTANTEFETLTGMSLSQFQPQMNTPYQMLIPKYRNFPSAVGYFRTKGYQPIAIHPFTTAMYRRAAVYPVLGFDRFIHDTTMHYRMKIESNQLISDQSAFDEVNYQIRTHTDPLFINLVTMQNHYPMAGKYANPIHVTGVQGDAEAEAGGYARGIRYTDQALRNFIGELQKSTEKTIVLFYGDHLPAVWPDAIYDKNGNRRMKETPFFVWSNFEQYEHRALPTTSPIYFMPTMLDAADAPLPPYYVLLDMLRKKIPAMEQGMYIDSGDQMTRREDLDVRAKSLLHDYRLVQYDLSVGHRYSQRAMFYPVDTRQTVRAARP
jgi:phosphoglycerol transferase MdoB-like AlkP superfamily enzyme